MESIKDIYLKYKTLNVFTDSDQKCIILEQKHQHIHSDDFGSL